MSRPDRSKENKLLACGSVEGQALHTRLGLISMPSSKLRFMCFFVSAWARKSQILVLTPHLQNLQCALYESSGSRRNHGLNSGI